jgi:hypothetical protein
MLHCDQQHFAHLAGLLARYGLHLAPVPDNAAIPGSYWGEPEAGLVGHTVHARADTPVHSVLHEAGHVICMDTTRRAQLYVDAGGEYAEEDAVCYLQIVLAGELGLSVEEICADMDAWGYTFRLGSAHVWFTQDADDARAWLVQRGLLTEGGVPTFCLCAA